MLTKVVEGGYGNPVSELRSLLRHRSQQARVDNDVPPASCLMEEGDDTAAGRPTDIQQQHSPCLRKQTREGDNTVGPAAQGDDKRQTIKAL